ncbi:SoxR reducing system RseC family protein [bacterium]|nr:SoxR reducing system RseC family protein [bacterium]
MIEVGQVTALKSRHRAEVQLIRSQDCGSCKVCDMFYGGKGKGEGGHQLITQNNIDAKVGEYVRLEIEPRRMIGASATMFLLPILAFLAGYIAIMLLFGSGTNELTALAIGGGILTMVLTFIPISRNDKKRKEPLVVLIEKLGDYRPPVVCEDNPA